MSYPDYLLTAKNDCNIAKHIMHRSCELRAYINLEAKPSLKIRTANAIFWISFGIFRDYGQKNILFRNKTFLFFKIES